ncbi:TMEM175 family protein [Mumia sp. DW29H23]|uniref:TMEM175 family protein n=1 Tax=Mumia sp. DW29H23 TaxID=3421241 RepID=UPI003D6824DD
MRSERGLDRLLAFSDAVVAIALTLLVLPLVEVVSGAGDADSVLDLVADDGDAFLSFAISFLVIWVLWGNHHAMMEHFSSYDGVVVGLHFVWLLTIVLLPFTTQLLDAPDGGIDGAAPTYVATLLVSIGALVALGTWGRRHPGLLRDGDETAAWTAAPTGLATVALLLLALVVTIAVPAVGVLALFLLFLTGPLERLLASRRRRRSVAG